MGLMDLIREDMQDILNDEEGFSTELSLTAPDGTTATIRGLASRIHLAVDFEGNITNTTQVHCSFAEKALTDAEYPVRNAAGMVTVKGHKVAWTDATGTSKTYVISESYPDDTLGLISCSLSIHRI